MNEPGDRRPIAARDWRPIRAAATWLVRQQAAPNGISVAGMAAALLAGTLFALIPAVPDKARLLWACGAVLIQLRLLANVLDGMVAVGRGVASRVGELFNEVPDRISDTAVLAGVGHAVGEPALGWAAALFAMLTA
ncbi:MAG: CDP-alcohol phosphatidyltransferase family protein, partial [Acetobacteraceae bacterium]|nr:CDP-alcohol phosphatidyltransferase family protein [Acetobacteraceae bacterium]